MTTTGTVCASCGIEPSRVGARFCDACGAPIEAAATAAEFKQVTVLFADVVHSMDIAAAVGAERLREIMTDLVNRSAAVVQRYGGTVDKFTGDGIMALFGAPVALEDHAVRACLAALDIQAEAKRIADEVERHDGVVLQLRVGLNSGEVIAGESASGAMGYTAVGEQVGMAQRMESVARPGGVMLSGSTARLVEHAAVMGDPELVSIKGSKSPVSVRALLGIESPRDGIARAEAALVGRQWEMNAVEAILNRAVRGRGGVVNVVGSPGIGKSRLVREIMTMAAARGAEAFWTFCESHAREIPFHAVARLLSAGTGVAGLDGPAARAQLRARLPDADEQDLVLLDDLLGVRDPGIPLPNIDPDARRRRLTALINGASLSRTQPAVYVIEDAHWIDEVSESMLADFLTVIPRTPSMVLITYRPEYQGALARVAGAQTINLEPLDDSETTTLLGELLGSDASVDSLAPIIAARAGGNPFFAQEIVRDLTERNVLHGRRGAYVCGTVGAEVSVPATLQATIAARIDRLDPNVKRALSAAAVIGSRFSAELLIALGVEPILDDLVKAELIDQVQFIPHAEYEFHHPLIRSVAYESQLKSDRAEVHRRLAAGIEARDPELVDEHAAMIAEHLEAAGDLREAFGWHMRAGAWSAIRDIVAAHVNWERARQIADALPVDQPGRNAMRIAPRTLQCANGWRVHVDVSGTRFAELRELCQDTGDKASLAIGMAGLVIEHHVHAYLREASRLASECMTLVESIGDPDLTVGLSFLANVIKVETLETADVLRWSQEAIDLAHGDPAKSAYVIGSPLTAALVMRGNARWALGLTGWREDFDHAVATAGESDPMSQAFAIGYKYVVSIPAGVIVAEDDALHEIDEALRIAQRSSDDIAVGMLKLTQGIALMHHRESACRLRGVNVLTAVREMCLDGLYTLSEVEPADVYIAREQARSGDRDGAIPQMRAAVDVIFERGQLGWFVPAVAVLVETLLDRGTEDDFHEARNAVDRLADIPRTDNLASVAITMLRVRALFALARGKDAAYRDSVSQYRAMAESLGYEGHMAWAQAMT